MKFGELVKQARIEKRLTLRQCCQELGVDPSNWSKMERDVNRAPKDITILEQWAQFFGLRGEAKQTFFDAAALSRQELPADLASDEQLLTALPAFFRAVRGNEMNATKMQQFIADLRAVHSPDKRERK